MRAHKLMNIQNEV